MESESVKEQVLNSIACNSVKTPPRRTVRINLIFDSFHFESIIDICLHVIVAPLERRTIVFRRGTSKGEMGTTPLGGQTDPNSIEGLREEWKNAQKKAKKKHTSLRINNIIPQRIPLSTFSVCLPCRVASRETSRHHCTTVSRSTTTPILSSI